MNEIIINEKISYIECAENPLSADIGIIRDNGISWLFDVGNGEKVIEGLDDSYNVVLSHFHKDHIGNVDKIKAGEIFLSKQTYKYTSKGTIVDESIYIGNLHIFPLPTTHAKGSLGLEIDGTYAFVGDGLYGRSKDGKYVYNAQLLREEIAVLKNLSAPFLLVSHLKGLICKKEAAISHLEKIYEMKLHNEPYISIDIKV